MYWKKLSNYYKSKEKTYNLAEALQRILNLFYLNPFQFLLNPFQISFCILLHCFFLYTHFFDIISSELSNMREFGYTV